MHRYAKSTLPFVAGSFVSILLINAASTDTAVDSATVKTISNRNLIDVVSDMDQAMVIEGTLGFTLRLYTNDQIAVLQKKAEAHNQRYEEYAAKKRFLQKHQEDFKRRAPKIMHRIDAEIEDLLKVFDNNGNDRLDVEEMKGEFAEHFQDHNQDLQIDKVELAYAYASKDAKSQFTLAEIKQLMAERAQMEEQSKKLATDYQGTTRRKRKSYYHRIVEVAPSFIRLDLSTEERVIPVASIHEIRRKK